jgi:type III secretion system YscJ/HrcJ family lipoprotein
MLAYKRKVSRQASERKAFLRRSFLFIALLIGICGVMSGCEGQEVIIEDLSQRDTLKALLLLRDKNIDAQKEVRASKKNVTYNITVKTSQAREAVRLLLYNHIPEASRATLKDVYPPGSSNLIPSKSDELARFIMAMQGETESLLKAIPGVMDARVVFSFEPPLNFKSTQTKRAASVLLIYQASPNQEAPLTDGEIKHLVASGLFGLNPEDVTVVQKTTQFTESPNKLAINNTSAEISGRPLNSFFLWGLILLTALAMMIAGYGLIRLYWGRQKEL